MPRPLPEHVLKATGGEAEAIRAYILDAAYRVIVARGLAAAGTRAIAAEAEVSSGTLYNYFDNRLQLLAQAMHRRIQLLSQPLGGLLERAGQETVAANLLAFAKLISATLDELVPLGAAAFSDPELLAVMREEFPKSDASGKTIDILVSYLHAEQKLGRISPTADHQAAATLIFRICHDQAFHRFLHGRHMQAGALTREVDFIADALQRGMTDPNVRSEVPDPVNRS